MGSDTGAAVRAALIWNLANQSLSQLVAAGVFLFLATRLDPAAFGVFALAVLVVDAFATEARTALLDLLLVRRDFSAAALATAFYAAFIGACGAYGFVLVLVPAVAAALDAPGLAPLVAVLGLSILLAPPFAVCEALVLRDLRFGAVAARNMAASLISAAAALGFCFAGAEQWALVGQRLAGLIAGLVFLVLLVRWRPALIFHAAEARALLRPFAKLWLGQMINFGLGRIVDLIIGVRLGAGPLGVYRVAARFVEIVLAAVAGPLTGVFIPVLARYHGRPAERREQYMQIIALASAVSVPALAGLSLLAPDLTRVFLDERYADATVTLTILAATGLIVPFAHFRGVVLVAASRPGLAVRLAVFDLATTAGAVWIGAGHGLPSAALATMAASVIAGVVTTMVLARVLQVGSERIVRACAPPYAATAFMAAVLVAAAGALDGWSPALRMAVMVCLGALAFCGYLAAFHRSWVSARLSYLHGSGPQVRA